MGVTYEIFALIYHPIHTSAFRSMLAFKGTLLDRLELARDNVSHGNRIILHLMVIASDAVHSTYVMPRLAHDSRRIVLIC